MSRPSSSGLSKRQPLYPQPSSLLYPSPTPSPYPSPFYTPTDSPSPPPAPFGSTRALEALEGQTEARLSGLAGKVQLLKDITLGIGHEVRDGTAEMESMNSLYALTTTHLTRSIRRLSTLSARTGGQTCALLGFLLVCGWILGGLWWVRR